MATISKLEITTSLVHEPGATETIAAFYSANGIGVPAETVKLRIQRASDSLWWDFGTSSWEVWVNNLVLTELDAVNLPGLYSASLDWAALSPVPGAEGDFNVFVYVSAVADDAGVLKLRQGLSTLAVNDGVVPTPAASPNLTLAELLTALMVYVRNNQQINDAAKQHVFFSADGVTPAMAFDTLDAAGLATTREVFKKERV